MNVKKVYRLKLFYNGSVSSFLQLVRERKMKINPSILASIGVDQFEIPVIPADSRSFCERTVIEDFLRLCDIPGISPQWCIDQIQSNL